MEQIIKINDLDVKPCPFCGDTHITVDLKNTRYMHGYSIGCQSLRCVCCHSYGRVFETKDDAVKAWNKRI